MDGNAKDSRNNNNNNKGKKPTAGASKMETESKYLPELLAEKDSLDSSFTHAMKLLAAGTTFTLGAGAIFWFLGFTEVVFGYCTAGSAACWAYGTGETSHAAGATLPHRPGLLMATSILMFNHLLQNNL